MNEAMDNAIARGIEEWFREDIPPTPISREDAEATLRAIGPHIIRAYADAEIAALKSQNDAAQEECLRIGDYADAEIARLRVRRDAAVKGLGEYAEMCDDAAKALTDALPGREVFRHGIVEGVGLVVSDRDVLAQQLRAQSPETVDTCSQCDNTGMVGGDELAGDPPDACPDCEGGEG